MDAREIERQFYVPQEGVGDLLQGACSFSEQGATINGAIFSISGNIADTIRTLKKRVSDRAKLRFGDKEPYIVTAPFSSSHRGRSIDIDAKFFFWQDSVDQVVYLLSCHQRDAFTSGVSRLRDYAVSRIGRVFLRTGEMRKMLREIDESHPGASVRIREYVARGLIDDPDSEKRVETDRIWTDEEYRSVFTRLSDENKWVSALTVELRGSVQARGRLWNDGSFSCHENFEAFHGIIVKRFKETVVSNREFFQNRGRSESPTGKSRPLVIAYEENVFSDNQENYRLSSVLEDLPESALSVFHPNPYFHASLIDYADGSSYEIWVTSPTEILVVPKKRATLESLERVCNHVCEDFEEGTIREPEAHG